LDGGKEKKGGSKCAELGGKQEKRGKKEVALALVSNAFLGRKRGERKGISTGHLRARKESVFESGRETGGGRNNNV